MGENSGKMNQLWASVRPYRREFEIKLDINVFDVDIKSSNSLSKILGPNDSNTTSPINGNTTGSTEKKSLDRCLYTPQSDSSFELKSEKDDRICEAHSSKDQQWQDEVSGGFNIGSITRMEKLEARMRSKKSRKFSPA